MKDTIYTIPLTDAFKNDVECPFCSIQNKLEQDQISFTLGASYMEDDIRAITDELGFCDHHYKKLYEYGNRLGLALILQTHYEKTIEKIDTLFEKNTLPKISLLNKFKKTTSSTDQDNTLASKLHELSHSCYICEGIQKDMDRYIKTFFYLINHHEDFKSLYKESQGFCLHHYSLLLEKAPLYLNETEKTFFLETSKEKLISSLKRIHEDISWFIDKYDYRNANKPMGNAVDALPRGIKKLSGANVLETPFKESNL